MPNLKASYINGKKLKSVLPFFSQDYYKNGVIYCGPNINICELREACDYLLLPFDANTVKCHNLR